ncbi:MAG: hypothetical protein ACYCV7_02895 [Acidimicrobiales bacterium]
MSSQGGIITRADIEDRFRELTGEVSAGVEGARSQIIAVGSAVAVTLIAIAYLAGRRRGRTRSAVVEVRSLR